MLCSRKKFLGRYLSLLNRAHSTVGDLLTTCLLSVSSKSCSQNFLIGKGRLLLQSVWSTHFPFIFFKKLLLILPLQRKVVTYFLRAVERAVAHCDGMMVWYVWYVYFLSLSQPLITLLMLFSHWMTSRDNRGMSEIDANGLNIVRDINCWLRYEIKNGSVGYSSRNAGCT